jgi:hypothetical protein
LVSCTLLLLLPCAGISRLEDASQPDVVSKARAYGQKDKESGQYWGPHAGATACVAVVQVCSWLVASDRCSHTLAGGQADMESTTSMLLLLLMVVVVGDHSTVQFWCQLAPGGGGGGTPCDETYRLWQSSFVFSGLMWLWMTLCRATD